MSPVNMMMKLQKLEFEYVGDCSVCDEPVDLDDMGNCEMCKRVFHWGLCGTWNNGQHMCNECIEVYGEEVDERD